MQPKQPKNKLTRINNDDWRRIEQVRKQLVMIDGENRTLADALSFILAQTQDIAVPGRDAK